jgi:hypothetical protein
MSEEGQVSRSGPAVELLRGQLDKERKWRAEAEADREAIQRKVGKPHLTYKRLGKMASGRPQGLSKCVCRAYDVVMLWGLCSSARWRGD